MKKVFALLPILAGTPILAMGAFKFYFSGAHGYLFTNRTASPVKVSIILADLQTWDKGEMNFPALERLLPGKTENAEVVYDRLAPSACMRFKVRALDNSFEKFYKCQSK